MMTANEISAAGADHPAQSGAKDTRHLHASLWKTILWRDWQVNRGFTTTFAAAWVMLIFVFPVINTSVGVLVMVVVLGQVLATRLGASDVLEGSEAFAFALPPGRGDYFHSRFLFGLALVAFFLLAGVTAVILDLPAKAWGLVVQSGLTQDGYIETHSMPLPVVIALGIGPYMVTFSIAAMSRNSAAVAAWLGGLTLYVLPALTVTILIAMAFDGLSSRPAWMIFTTLASLVATSVFLLGWRVYLVKSASDSRASARGTRKSSGLWLLGVAGALLVVIMVFFMLVTRERAMQAERAQAEALRAQMEVLKVEQEAARRREEESPEQR